MTRYSLKPGRRSLGVVALALLVTLVGLLASQGATAADGTFDPSSGVELSDHNCDANADITKYFGIPKGDLQFDTVVYFTPQEFLVAGPGDVPIGAHGGEVSSVATLGLLNGACNTTLAVSFDMLVATADTSDTVGPDVEAICADGNGNGTVDCVDKYPEFLNEMFPGIEPRSRLCGCTNVAGVVMSMNLPFFEPGTNFDGDVGSFPSDWGYPSVTVLNNPKAPPAPGAITDFCTPLETASVAFGLTEDNPNTPEDESGQEHRRNPHWGGFYTFRVWARSQLDADEDGNENPFDTCPFHPNIDEDPRDGTGPDGDGIDSACDPDPDAACWPGAPGMGADCDADGYMNRQDNCPMVSNPFPGYSQDSDQDGIGDMCEGDVSEEDLGMPPIDGCDDATDDDGDTVVNDGCPAVGAAETNCDEDRLACAGGPPSCDDDADTVVNDGCPVFGFGDPDEPDGDRMEVLLEQDVEIVCPPPPTQYVEIDVKPGSRSNSLNPKSGGKIRVGVLSSADFDATTVDPDTVLFAGAPPVRETVRDVDHDGRSDLLLAFRIPDTNVAPGDTEACLEGQTYDGQGIEGCDSVRTVP